MTQARTVPQPAGRLAVAGGLGLAVAVALYALGQTHTPSYTMGLLGQHGLAVNRLKAQLGTAMLGLALVQLTLALWMYRKLPGVGAAPPTVPVLHRLGGASLFLLSLPVAVHCMFAYGVQLGDLRVAVHSLAGCFFLLFQRFRGSFHARSGTCVPQLWWWPGTRIGGLTCEDAAAGGCRACY